MANAPEAGGGKTVPEDTGKYVRGGAPKYGPPGMPSWWYLANPDYVPPPEDVDIYYAEGGPYTGGLEYEGPLAADTPKADPLSTFKDAVADMRGLPRPSEDPTSIITADGKNPYARQSFSERAMREAEFVFMGDMQDVAGPHMGGIGDDLGDFGSTKGEVISVSEADLLPYSWSPKEVKANIKKMEKAGMEVPDFATMVEIWGAMVDRSANTLLATGGKTLVTPWDALERISKEEGGGTGPDKMVTTTKKITEFDDGDAWVMLKGMAETTIGRAPTDQEARDFLSRLNAAAAGDPSIVKTVDRQGEDGNVTTTEKTVDTGFGAGDAARLAEEEMMADPEYAKVQGATTYANALIAALGPTTYLDQPLS